MNIIIQICFLNYCCGKEYFYEDDCQWNAKVISSVFYKVQIIWKRKRWRLKFTKLFVAVGTTLGRDVTDAKVVSAMFEESDDYCVNENEDV